jgi:hypothetical protein
MATYDHNTFHHFFKFKHPTTIAVSGPSQVGKSQFCIKLLKNLEFLMTPCPTQIIWAYGIKNEKQMDQILSVRPNVEFVEGIPDTNLFCDPDINSLVILDDLMNEASKNANISKLFTMDSHHCNASVISVQHNIFNQEKFSRTNRINTHYEVVFNLKKDKGQITRVNSQMYPLHPKFLQTAHQMATSKGRGGYLVIDSHPETPEIVSVVSGIFPDEIPVVYIPK